MLHVCAAKAILVPFSPMAKMTAVANMFLYTGLLRFLLSTARAVCAVQKHPLKHLARMHETAKYHEKLTRNFGKRHDTAPARG